MELDLPNPIHIIHDSRYARQDGWQIDDISLCSSGNIAVSGHNYRTNQSCVSVYSSIDDNSDSRDKPTLLYHKQFTHKLSWRSRYISFIKPNSTEIVTCRYDEVQVIDYNRDVVLRSRKVNGETTCVSVSESQIFIGLLRSDIVNIYDNDLNEIKSIKLKGIRSGDYPWDMVAAADRLYVCTAEYGKAIVYSQHSSNILTEYTTGQDSSKAYSIAVNIQLQIVAVLWNRKHVSVYSFRNNNCLVDFSVEFLVTRIRISDRGRIVTGNIDTGDVRICHDLIVLQRKFVKSSELAQILSLDEIQEIRKHFKISEIESNQNIGSDEGTLEVKNVWKILTVLEGEEIPFPNKANELKTLFDSLGRTTSSKLSGPIRSYQKYTNMFDQELLQHDRRTTNAGRFNDSVSVGLSHEIPRQRFPKQDDWHSRNIINVVDTTHGLVCYVMSGKKREVLTQLFKLPSLDSSDEAQVIYSKVISRQGNKTLFLTFIDDIHLVMCYNKTLEIIDINCKTVLRECQLSAAAKVMAVEEGEIFVVEGDSSEVLVFNSNLERITKLTFNIPDWKYPVDMKVTSERLFIICKVKPGDSVEYYNWQDRAMSFRRGNPEMEANFTLPVKHFRPSEPVSIAAHKESGFVGILWSKTQHSWRRHIAHECMVSLHTLSGCSVFLLDVEESHSIQILNKSTMIVINQTDGLKYYNMAHFFSYNILAVRLSGLVTLPECKGLQNLYRISDDDVNNQGFASSYCGNLSAIRRRFLNLFKTLEEKDLVGPNKLDDFIVACDKVRSKLFGDYVEAYWKVKDGSHPQPSGFPVPFQQQQQHLQDLPHQSTQQVQQHDQKHTTASQSELVAEQHPDVLQQTQQTAHKLSASRKETQLLAAEQHPAVLQQNQQTTYQLSVSRQEPQLLVAEQHPAVLQQTQQTTHQLSVSRQEPQLLVAEQHPAVLQQTQHQLSVSRQEPQLLVAEQHTAVLQQTQQTTHQLSVPRQEPQLLVVEKHPAVLQQNQQTTHQSSASRQEPQLLVAEQHPAVLQQTQQNTHQLSVSRQEPQLLVAEQHPAVLQQTQQTTHQLSVSRQEPQLLVAEQHPAVLQQTQQTAHQLSAARKEPQLQHPYQHQWQQDQLGYNKRLQYQQSVGYIGQPSGFHKSESQFVQQITFPQSLTNPAAFSPHHMSALYHQEQGFLHNQQQVAYNPQMSSHLPSESSFVPHLQGQQLLALSNPLNYNQQAQSQQSQQFSPYQAQTSYQHEVVELSHEEFCQHGSVEHMTSSQETISQSSAKYYQDALPHQPAAHSLSAMDKKFLLVHCLKKKILYLSETKKLTSWEKFSRWKSTDVFVSCWLSLIDRKSMGSVKDTNVQCKLKYTEIFTHDELKSETRIAIQGGPGSGKTMLLSQLALDWCNGKLTDVDVLVYMPLKTVKDKTLIQAIKNFYIPENTAISETDIESILASDAETVCLLLDGLEDYRSGRTMGAKQSSDVRRILKKEAFPNCKVVVTSRSYFIQDIFDRSLLKVGELGETERNSYIEKLSQGNIKREEKLKQLIEDDSFLLGLFNVPLFFSLAVENIESMGLASDSLFDKVTPFVQNIVETLFLSSMSGPETWSESEQLTLGDIAFNGLCKELKQASWSSNFIETKTSRLKHWLDCRILAMEQILTEQPGKEYQDTDENNEMPNRENMEDVTEQKGLQTYKHGGSKDKETSQSLGNVETQQHARYGQEKKKQSYEATVRIRFLHEVFQELFAATYLCSMMNHFADEDQFHEYVIKQLQKLNPENQHYVLRFTSYLHPRSCSVIINYLLTNFLPKDSGIPSHIMDCIFLCFAEHNGTKGHDIKNSITEVCKEVITIDYEDGRFLQKAKTSLLQYASACGIMIEEVRLDNVISTVDDTFLTFNSGTKLEPLDTLQLIEVSQEDQVFHQDDFGNILKHFSRGNSIKTILCIFPCHPPKIVDDIIIENVKLKNIEVEWNNGEVIWTLDPTKQIFLPIYDLMKKAGHFELKSMEYDPKSYEHFPMSLPHTSLKSFGKWPTKRPLSKLTHSDTKLDFKAKRLKANWNLKVKNETEYKREQDEEEILDLSKEEPSTSYNREKILKDEGHSQDVSIMKIKAEPFWDDSEQDICTLKDEPSTSYDEGKFLTEEGPSQDVSPVIIKEETSKTDSEQDIWTVKEEPLTSNDEEEFVKEETPSHDYSSAPNEEETSESSPEQDIWRMNTTGHFEESQHTSPHGRRQLQAQEVITQFGGTIHIPDTDIVLNVPPDALPENMQECLISMRIIPLSMSHDESTSFSSNSSVRVELLPNHLKFRCHIELTLPHCLVLKKNVVYRARVFQSHHSEGERPQWEEQRDQPYDLRENICIIWLKSFCWIKFDIDDEIVEGKRLKLYTAATKMYLADMYASVEVGYHLDMPGEQEILKMNPKLILAQRKPFVFLREGQHPLFIRLARIIPHQWKYSDRNPKEIPFHSVAASVEYSCPFVVEKEIQDRDIPLCVFVAAQVQRIGKSVRERTVELVIRPEVNPFATPWDVR